MPALRDNPQDFARLIGAAAQELRVPESLIEKDYWLTQVLRAVNDAHFGQFVLKGGTSLSKGYRLLERFSEDVDLLLVPQGRDKDRDAVERLLGQIEATVEAVTGLETSRQKAEEGVATITVAPYKSVIADDAFTRAIRVDHGVPGRPLPCEHQPLHTLLSDAIAAAGNNPRGVRGPRAVPHHDAPSGAHARREALCRVRYRATHRCRQPARAFPRRAPLLRLVVLAR